MGKYVFKRIVMIIPVLIGVTFLIFALLYITPGDPAQMILGPSATNVEINTLRNEMGLKDPFWMQYVGYMFNLIVRQDMGSSYMTREPVFDTLVQRFPTTLLYTALSMMVMLMIGIPMGIISAVKQYSWLDTLCRGVTIIGVSIPSFWLGIMFIIQFSINLRWFPSSGFDTPIHWVLPSLTLGIVSASIVTRTTRSCMLEVVRQDYIRTARAKGQSEGKIIFKHALKNALIPILTVLGNQIAFNMGGAIICESVFSIPGIGKLMVDSIKQRDYPLVQGGVLFIAFAACVIYLVVDILYSCVDPRIKSIYTVKKESSISAELEEEGSAA